jgi:hypothetical protein
MAPTPYTTVLPGQGEKSARSCSVLSALNEASGRLCRPE